MRNSVRNRFSARINPNTAGVWPAIIHNNWIVGTSNKMKRLHNWSLASADEEAGVCLPLDVLPQPTLPGNTIREEADRQAAMIAEAAKEAAARPKGLDAAAEAALMSQQAKLPALEPLPLPFSAPTIPTPFLLRLRVFAYTDATRLRRLLSSLAAATDW
jgi:hypothetical protein